MSNDRNELKVKLPGLQVYSNGNLTRSSSTLNSFHSFQHLGPNSTLLANAQHPPYIELHNKKLSDWGIESIHDNSPTVVSSSEFSVQDHSPFLEDDFDEVGIPMTGCDANRKFSFERMMMKIFSESPFGAQNYAEEFQYTIVASQLLTDSIRPLWNPLPNRPEPLFFKKCTGTGWRESSSGQQVSCKYGKFVTTNKKLMLYRTMPFIPTFVLVRRCLILIDKSNIDTKSSRVIFCTLCVAIYLAIQQELFFSHYPKHLALVTLRNVVEQLQILDKLLHRLHIRYKELTIYKPIALIQSPQVYDANLAVIKDILAASLDMMYYELKSIAVKLLPILRNQELFRYCEIYGINFVDLYFAVNSEANDMSDKAARTHLLKKFILCCLLSIDQRAEEDSDENEKEYNYTLRKIFAEFEPAGRISESKRSHSRLKRLQEIFELLRTLISFLEQYKSLLSDNLGPSKASHSLKVQHNQNHRNKTTLNELRDLQNLIITDSRLTEEQLCASVLKQLGTLTKIWQSSVQDKKRSTIETRKERHCSGLQLNIVQSPSIDSSEFSTTGNLDFADKPMLASDIEFKQVGTSDSDFESEIEGDAMNTENVYVANEDSENRDVINTLTDEELRRKLNQRIMSLAMENRKGKQNLRTKKSFGLLDGSKAMNIKDRGQPGSRPSYMSKLTSEESIPVLYELKQMLQKK
ncbi:LADA_0C02256g1_1 [Lachancea dasiensis]|uniref:Inheritance of peroxisomes protein 2 n=1 Tax=Lachancea dasiensis TaxID=1072105 RepID=A0A1G4IXW8_9SACH|nr:LADA_0C02256g1_1 [Lachancea dasiensis]